MKYYSSNPRLVILSFLLLLISVNSRSQSIESIISSDRIVDWAPGMLNSIPNYPVAVNVKDFGAAGDGLHDDTQSFKNAIDEAQTGQAVLIPEGTYLITSTLKITKSIVLRGEGADKSKIYFDFNDGGDGISIEKYKQSDWQNMVSGFEKGSNTIVVEDGSSFDIGDFVEINQNNDPEIYSEGYKGSFDEASMGQVLQITNVSNHTLTFSKKIYIGYNPTANPRIRSIGMVENAGIEKLYLERINDGPWGKNISLISAANCWIREIWSEKTITAHVFVKRSYQNEIRGNYFHDSHAHDAGGQGYGIRMEERSTDNLVENNIFERLRHSMLVQLGASGNVFGYNYSKDPFFEEGNDWLMSDVSAHGHYSNMNLFEGNTVQYILIDNVWGTNGSTTLFRNRIEKDVSSYLDGTEKFAFIKIDENNPNHNIVGNELGIESTSSSTPIILNSSITNSTIVHGNYSYQDGTISWDSNIPEHNLPNSLYLIDKPVWFGEAPWPAIGSDIAPNNNLIPAQARYKEGKYIPDDSSDPVVTTMQPDFTQKTFTLYQNFPNPFNPSTTIDFNLSAVTNVKLEVYNSVGKKVATIVSERLNPGMHNYRFDGKNLATGIYYYQLIAGRTSEIKKMLLIR